MAAANSRWLTGLAAALAIVLAAALLLMWRLRARYESRLRQQIWTDRVPEPTIISNGPPGLARTVLLLGDSRMEQWGLPPLAHWHVINAGTSGLTTAQIRLCAPALLDRFHPDAVVLQAGINDLKYLGLRPEMTSRVVPLVLGNITAIVRDGAAGHCKVILFTTWPAGKPGLARTLIWNKAVSAAVDQLNGQLLALDSAVTGIRVVDVFKQAGLNPDAQFYRDTLHLTSAAYLLLTPLLQSELDKAQPLTNKIGPTTAPK